MNANTFFIHIFYVTDNPNVEDNAEQQQSIESVDISVDKRMQVMSMEDLYLFILLLI